MRTSVKELFPTCVHYPGTRDTKDHAFVMVGDDQLPEYVVVSRGYDEKRRYLPETTCTMEPTNLFEEHNGIYVCSNCGKAWQLPYDGPTANGWMCCPHCKATIKEGVDKL